MSQSARAKKTGLAPGTPVYTGDVQMEHARITVIDFGPKHYELVEAATLEDCVSRLQKQSVTWVDVVGLSDVETVSAVCQAFGVHSLAGEDILSVASRPKAEDYGENIHVLLKDLVAEVRGMPDSPRVEIDSDQVSLIVGRGFVLTFQEKPGDSFGPVRRRLAEGQAIRGRAEDYLAFALMDSVVDQYFVVLDDVDGVIDALEEDLLEKVTQETLNLIHRCKRQLMGLRKAVAPLREAITSLQRMRSPLIAS